MRNANVLLVFVLFSITAGCASDRPEPPPISAIPERAVLVGEGSGRLFFAAPMAGTLYIYDADMGRLIFAQPMKANERFALDPMTREMTVEGKPIPTAQFTRKHVHRLYYHASAPPPPKP